MSNFSNGPGIRRPTHHHERTSLIMARILVVCEDAAFIHWRLKTTLCAQGHDVIETACLDEAVSLLISSSPDLVLLDLYLSDRLLVESIILLRQVQPRVKILAVIEAVMAKNAAARFANGATTLELLPRPFGAEEFLERVERLLNAH